MDLALLVENGGRKSKAPPNLAVIKEPTAIVSVPKVGREHPIIERVLQAMSAVTLVRAVRVAVLQKVSPSAIPTNPKVAVNLCVVVVAVVVVAVQAESPI